MSESGMDFWKAFEAGFPQDGAPAAIWAFLAQYAVRAPSGHNTQPWLFYLRGSDLELHADRTRALSVVDPEDRELIISCGAALFHLRAALRRFGYDDHAEILPDAANPDLLARLALKQASPPTSDEERLFAAIPHRHTNRRRYEEKPISPLLLEELESLAWEDGVWMHVVLDQELRDSIADLIAEADRAQWMDRRFRRELAAWVHPNRSHSGDGLPGYAFGLSDMMSYAGPLVVRTFDWGAGAAAKDRQLASGAPALAIYGTEGDESTHWLATGQALAKTLLRACADGVTASYLNQPVEVPELRPKLAEILGRNGFPQLVLRMGYGPESTPTPRRPVREVLRQPASS